MTIAQSNDWGESRVLRLMSTSVAKADTLYAMERIGQVLVETYRVDRLIAEGGMAYVFEASHLRIPKRFAVKFLKMSLVHNSEALLRFRREAEIIATLDHPNIVNLVDYNVSEDGAPYIVMEFLDGEHLGKRLEAGVKLPVAEMLRITQSVSAALEAAHARDIVHRDLKPENIILCKGDVEAADRAGADRVQHHSRDGRVHGARADHGQAG